jgi:CRP/FNR family transcriptional regulator, putaive post-exponential-phase nitrogen-starvation regulator
MDSIEGFVKRFRLSELLSPDLAASLRLVRRASGELLIRSGDPARDLLFFVEGRVKTYSTLGNGQSVLASFARPFEVFGEAELLSAERYTLSIEAIDDSACLALSAEGIKKAADRNGRLFMFLCSRLGSKLSSRIIAESINLRYPVERRLASYLLATADERGDIRGAAGLGELADFIGASYRQLSRAVRRFRDEGLLDPRRGSLRVLDRTALEAWAADDYPGMAEAASADSM